MFEKNQVSYDAVSEAYCLISSYIREEGKVADVYDTEVLEEFVNFLASVMTNSNYFPDDQRIQKERLKDGSLVVPIDTDHDGSGLA